MAKPIRHRDKWRIRWIDEQGTRRSEVLGSFREAEERLRERKVEVDRIRRGLQLPSLQVRTFDELVRYWLSKRAIHKRSAKDDESITRRHLLPAFGTLTLTDITVERVDQYKIDKQHLNPKTLSNHLTLLISMLNLAKDLGWVLAVPRIKKPLIQLFSTDYRYLRTQGEIRRFLQAAHAEGALVYALYSCAVFTGMRQGELAGLRWEDVDFERRFITVQRSFNSPTKGGYARYVPILDPLLPTLREWRLLCGGPLVFSSRSSTVLQKSARVFQEVLHRVLDRADLVEPGEPERRHYIVFHSLRHTFASHWMMNGGDVFRLQRILGHKSNTMTMRYSHLEPGAFSTDYSRLGNCAPIDVGRVLSFPSPQ